MKTIDEFERAKQAFNRIYVFEAIVHPERYLLTADTVRAALNIGPHPDAVSPGLIEFVVANSKLTATFYTNELLDDLKSLRNNVAKVVEANLDEISFLEGAHFESDFLSVRSPDGQVTHFETKLPAIATHALKSRVAGRNEIRHALRGKSGTYLRRSLSDFKKAMKYVSDLHFFCHRSMESLLHFYADRDGIDIEKKKDKVWEILKNDLAVGDRDFENLKNWSKASRHGQEIYFDDADGVASLILSWDIIHAYIEKRSKEQSTDTWSGPDWTD